MFHQVRAAYKKGQSSTKQSQTKSAKEPLVPLGVHDTPSKQLGQDVTKEGDPETSDEKEAFQEACQQILKEEREMWKGIIEDWDEKENIWQKEKESFVSSLERCKEHVLLQRKELRALDAKLTSSQENTLAWEQWNLERKRNVSSNAETAANESEKLKQAYGISFEAKEAEVEKWKKRYNDAATTWTTTWRKDQEYIIKLTLERNEARIENETLRSLLKSSGVSRSAAHAASSRTQTRDSSSSSKTPTRKSDSRR